jgi:two-component system phosphate regulon sensor histidine kinase PhoR
VSWSNTLLKDDSGGVIGVCSIGEDITARKIAEQERSELFHMMTHDIKGPLSIVNGYSELILADDTPEPAREYAGEIRKASKRIFGLIEDMLTLSAMEASVGESRHEPVSVQELIEQAVFDLRIRADEMNIEVGLKFQTEYRPIVYGDRNLLRRAIENLLINAINYNKFAGGVSIETGRDGDSRIFVEVSDTGVGIPDTDMGHIFDKYYRSKVTGKRHGTGLGLAIVKQAVESCGGAVSARNNPDGGATFRVELPLEG